MSLWFSVTFAFSIIIFIMSASLGWPAGAATGLVATVAGEAVVVWARLLLANSRAAVAVIAEVHLRQSLVIERTGVVMLQLF